MPVIKSLLNQIATLFLNPLIILGFVVATLYLFWGIGQMILNADSSKLDEHRKGVIWGVVGLLIMFSVYGILRLVIQTFEIECNLYFC